MAGRRWKSWVLSVAVVLPLSLSAAHADVASCQWLSEVQTDKQVYVLGEQVHITCRLTNVGSDACLMGVPASGLVAYVEEGEQVLWRSVEIVLPSFTQQLFAPGDMIQDHWVWEMTDMSGTTVLPGEYGVSWGRASDVRTYITIVPEPGTLLLLCAGLWAAVARRRKGGL